jgi:hypothetical protein
LKQDQKRKIAGYAFCSGKLPEFCEDGMQCFVIYKERELEHQMDKNCRFGTEEKVTE